MTILLTDSYAVFVMALAVIGAGHTLNDVGYFIGQIVKRYLNK